ncbi:MAG: hypothetical protein A4E29_01213 [Methanomassiliicoccales archaeon PtaB.Bin134]|nr:MAG: hypothetical protein A4E29_01213 [Methanomassiliicoccales archaeon PtaB.Bin134]
MGFGRNPRSTAFLASSPAAIITDGLEVLVQEVMEAMSTSPSLISSPFLGPPCFAIISRKLSLTLESSMRSWGRFGPASDLSIVERSSSRRSLYSGSWPS